MPRELVTEVKEFRYFHFCCGLDGAKKGFNQVHPQVGSIGAVFRCIGSVDHDRAAIRDFNHAGPGRPGTVLDLFTRAQFIAFHGKEPRPSLARSDRHRYSACSRLRESKRRGHQLSLQGGQRIAE